MTLEASCPGCGHRFWFAPDQVPAQRLGFGPAGTEVRIVAYYPTCTPCGSRVEVPSPGRELPPRHALPAAHAVALSSGRRPGPGGGTS